MNPMLASDITDDLSSLSYPLFVSPKLDGVRAITGKFGVLSRNLKAIPNNYVQSQLSELPAGLDGELIVGSPTDDPYRRTVSGVMSEGGEPNFIFWMFDWQTASGDFRNRFHTLNFKFKGAIRNNRWRILPHYMARTESELLRLEEKFLGDGYEGAMIRRPDSPYKFGRSSPKEGYLLKLKRFADAEAKVLSFEPLMKNNNEVKINALGFTERSSHKANKEALETLGALRVVGINGPYEGVEFQIGTGMTAAVRSELWTQRLSLRHKVIKYRYFPGGSKDKPRFPVFQGFRPEGA